MWISRIDWTGFRRLLPWAAVVLVVICDAFLWFTAATQGFAIPDYGADYRMYRDAAFRWLAGDGYYHAYQLTGPYDVWYQDAPPVLYPPQFALLSLPFVVLEPLWTLIPVLGTAAICISWRPSLAGWLVIAGLVLFPSTYMAIGTANPTIWMVFICALATRWPAFGPWVLLKPTLAPYALVGIRHRSWWLSLGVFVVVSLAFLPMWFEYAAVLLNSRQERGIFYSFWHLVPMAIPVVAWVTRTTSRRSPSGIASPTRRRSSPDS